jgi:glycerate kinase
LAFGLAAFASGELESGFDVFARVARLERHLRWSDLVITGEGSVDPSTLMGKGVGQLARRCREMRKPCVAVGAVVKRNRPLHNIFDGIWPLTDLAGVEEAKSRAAFWLTKLTEQVAESAARIPGRES